MGGAYIYIDPTPSKNISRTKSMFWTALRVCNPAALAWGRCGHAPGLAWGGAGMSASLGHAQGGGMV